MLNMWNDGEEVASRRLFVAVADSTLTVKDTKDIKCEEVYADS